MYQPVKVTNNTHGVLSNLNLWKKLRKSNQLSESPPLLLKISSRVCNLKNDISFSMLQGELMFINEDNYGLARGEIKLPASLLRRLTPSQHEAAVWHEKHIALTNEGIQMLKDAYGADLNPESQADMAWIEDLVNETYMRFRQMRGRLEMLREDLKDSTHAGEIAALVDRNLTLVEFHISCLEAWKKFAAEQIWKFNFKTKMAGHKDKAVLMAKRMLRKM